MYVRVAWKEARVRTAQQAEAMESVLEVVNPKRIIIISKMAPISRSALFYLWISWPFVYCTNLRRRIVSSPDWFW